MPESLKNILLVMASSGFLVRPESGGHQGENKELWDQTWKRLERFLPDLKEELFPPEPEKPVVAEKVKEPEVEVEVREVEKEKEKEKAPETVDTAPPQVEQSNLADID